MAKSSHRTESPSDAARSAGPAAAPPPAAAAPPKAAQPAPVREAPREVPAFIRRRMELEGQIHSVRKDYDRLALECKKRNDPQHVEKMIDKRNVAKRLTKLRRELATLPEIPETVTV